MKGTRLCLQLEDGRFWRWYLTDADGNVCVQSISTFLRLTDAVQAIDDLRLLLSAV